MLDHGHAFATERSTIGHGFAKSYDLTPRALAVKGAPWPRSRATCCPPCAPFCGVRSSVFAAGRLIAAPVDAWPGDTYSGPLTPVSGTLGGAPNSLLVYAAYPTAGSSWRYKMDFTDTTLAQFIA